MAPTKPVNISLLRADISPYDFPGKVRDKDPTEFVDFSPEFQRWLGNFVDVYNENISSIESEINAILAYIP